MQINAVQEVKRAAHPAPDSVGAALSATSILKCF